MAFFLHNQKLDTVKIDKQKLIQGIMLILAAFFGGAGALGVAYQSTPGSIELNRDIDLEFEEEAVKEKANDEQNITFLPGTAEWEALKEKPDPELTEPDFKYKYEVEARWVQSTTLKGGGGPLPEIKINAKDRYDHTSKVKTNIPEKFFKKLKPAQLNRLLNEPLTESELEHVHSIKLVGSSGKR